MAKDATAFDVKAARKEAEAEITKERQAWAKDRIKIKLKELNTARTIVANLERELEELEHELAAGIAS